MNCLVDAQLPPALARLLSERGHFANHVADIGLQDSDNSVIWQWALAHNAVILTKDEDFHRRSLLSRQAPRIVWLRIGNTSKRALLAWFEPLLAQVEAALTNGETLVEVR